MDQYQLPLFFVDVHARAVVSPWDAPTRTRIVPLSVLLHINARLYPPCLCMRIQYVFVYIYIVSLLHLCATLCTNTHVDLHNWNHYTRDRFRARAHLIIDRALLLRSGLSRGGSTCWITLTDHYRCVIVVYSRIVAFSASFVARNSCFDGDSVFVLPYLKELL